MGKIQHIRLLMASRKLRSDVRVFGDDDGRTEDILHVGMEDVSVLYQVGSLQAQKPLK